MSDPVETLGRYNWVMDAFDDSPEIFFLTRPSFWYFTDVDNILDYDLTDTSDSFDIYFINFFLDVDFTAYNFVFLPIAVLFWLYFVLTRTANFINFFNINTSINFYNKIKMLSITSFCKWSLVKLSIALRKSYILFLLNL